MGTIWTPGRYAEPFVYPSNFLREEVYRDSTGARRFRIYCRCRCGAEYHGNRQSIKRRKTTLCSRCEQASPVSDNVRRKIENTLRRGNPRYLININTGCWVWQGATDVNGYGALWDGVGIRRAHIVMYQDRFGPKPPGMDLDHLCRNRACVNPDHLEPVTRSVNLQRGLGAKLNPEKVRSIRRMSAMGTPYNEIAVEFGVAANTISAVARRLTWRNVV